MARTSRPTAYARLTRRQARLALAAWGLVGVFCVGVTVSPLARGFADKPRRFAEGDVQLYRGEVDRIHAGQGYYEAAGVELRRRGYPTGSVFNWRMPTPFWVIGRMPAVVLGKALLCGLALALLLAAFEVLAREEDNVIRRGIACGLLLIGPLMPCVLGDLFVMPVLWAGIWIALSICAYGLNRPRLGVALGLTAVFFRELAMPYCAVAVAIAWWNRRRGELGLWILGLAAWLAFFAWHCHQAALRITPADRVHAEGWVQFGGAALVVAMAQMNAYLLLFPQWFTALYLVAALLGFAGWNTPLGQRCGLTACLYVTAFAIGGQEFNQYWGSLMAPLLCFGVVRFPASLRDLCRAAFSQQPTFSAAHA